MPNELVLEQYELGRKVTLQPKSLNKEERSVEAVIATETPCQRYFDYEVCDEILLMSGVTTPEKVPLLDTHDSWSTRSVLGSITDFKTNKGQLTGKLNVSSVEEKVFKKIEEGHLREISVGAIVKAYYYVKKGESVEVEGKTYKANNRPLIIAAQWEPLEGSLVPLAADKNCTIRSKQEPSNNKEGGPKMPTEPEKKEIKLDPIDLETERKKAADAERERVSEIYSSCRTMKLPEEFASRLVEDGTDLSTARKLILDEVKKGMADESTDDVIVTRDEKEKTRSGLIVATKRMLGAQVEPEEIKTLRGSELNSCRTVQSVIRSLLERSGTRTYSMSNEEVYNVMREAADGYVMADFADLLQTAGSSVLVDAFEKVNLTFTQWSGEQDLATFNTYKNASLSPVQSIDIVNEMHPLPELQVDEFAEEIALVTRAGVITLSRQAIITDQLGAFQQLLTLMGEAAARTLEKVGYDKLASLTITDSVTPSDLDEDSLEELNVTLMERKFTIRPEDGDPKEELIGAPGRYLIVPTPLRKTAIELTRTPTLGDDNRVNAFYGEITSFATPFLANKQAYYLLGNKGKTINRFYLNGNRAPMLDTFNARSNEALGVKFRIIFDVAVGLVSDKYITKNPGVGGTTTTTTGAPTTTTTTTTLG